jgi:TPR repeat protein
LRIASYLIDGTIIEKDESRGLEIFERLGNSGSHEALEYLGDYYYSKNLEKSLLYYERSEELGNLVTTFNLAYIYEDLNQIDKAIKYFEKASQNGFFEANYRLGLIYEKGCENLKIDFPKAIGYYHLASKDKPHPKSFKRLSSIHIKIGDFENGAKFLFQYCSLKSSFKKLIELLDLYPISWKKEYHPYWYAETDLNQNFLLVILLISKFRNESSSSFVKSVLVKGIANKIIQYLCHFKQIPLRGSSFHK